MKQDDRFFSIAGICALVVTVGAFIWFHREAIFRAGTMRTAHRVEVTADLDRSPTPPTTVSASVPTAVVEPPAIVPASYAPDAIEPDTGPADGWWTTDTIDLLFEAVVAVAEGRTPVFESDPLPDRDQVLVRLDRDERLVVAPGTHRRYQGMVEAIDAIDIVAVADAVDRLEEPWSKPDGESDGFRLALAHAIDHLLEVEPPDVEPDMISRGTYWGFADPEYAALTDAQKHMLLMGRSNARAVRSRLSEIRDLIGEIQHPVDPEPDPFFDEDFLVAEDEEPVPTESTTVAAPK
jgi:hypothetical protein